MIKFFVPEMFFRSETMGKLGRMCTGFNALFRSETMGKLGRMCTGFNAWSVESVTFLHARCLRRFGTTEFVIVVIGVICSRLGWFSTS